jgi:hypothetical protein
VHCTLRHRWVSHQGISRVSSSSERLLWRSWRGKNRAVSDLFVLTCLKRQRSRCVPITSIRTTSLGSLSFFRASTANYFNSKTPILCNLVLVSLYHHLSLFFFTSTRSPVRLLVPLPFMLRPRLTLLSPSSSYNLLNKQTSFSNRLQLTRNVSFISTSRQKQSPCRSHSTTLTATKTFKPLTRATELVACLHRPLLRVSCSTPRSAGFCSAARYYPLYKHTKRSAAPHRTAQISRASIHISCLV